MSKRWSQWVPYVASSAMLGAIAYSAGCVDDDQTTPTQQLTQDASTPDSLNDQPPTDGAATDAPDAPDAPCDLHKPFGQLVPVAALNTGTTQAGARLSADQLTVYFAQDGNIKRATRLSDKDTFGTPVDVDVTTPIPGASPTPSADGKSLYFERNAGGVKIFWATAADGGFEVQGPVPTLADPTNTGQPFVRGDGTMIYFASRSTSTDAGTSFGGLDIYRATILDAGEMSAWQQVRNIGTADDEGYPVVSPNADLLYYARNETATNGNVYQIHAAAFDEVDAGYSSAGEDELVIGLNDGVHFFRPSWISPDGCTLWVTSNRDADAGANETKIFTATRPK